MIYFVDAEELLSRVGEMQIVEVVEAWASEDYDLRIAIMQTSRSVMMVTRRKVPLLDGIAIAQGHDGSDLPSDDSCCAFAAT